MLRAVRAIVAVGALSLPLNASTAAAQGPQELGWWLKASGAVQVVTEANHVWIEGHADGGGHQGRMVDWWLDWYCQVGPITGGDNQGTPFRLRLISTTPGVACLPNGQSQFCGWHTGTGWCSGQNFWNGWHVSETPYYVFPRDPADPWSQGTLVEVW